MAGDYKEVYRSEPVLERIRRVYRRGGAWFTLRSALRLAWVSLKVPVLHAIYRVLPPRRFTLRGTPYAYVRHGYNTTWQNERAVELPVAWAVLDRARGRRILEVGHVLGHYFPIRHQVLDKYENAPGILQEDAVDFRPAEKYDLILSVSTLEHVGWDEEPQDPGKFLRTVDNLRHSLRPGGTFFFTLPVGWNPHVDRFLKEGKISGADFVYMKKDGNKWRESSREEVLASPYDRSVPSATGLVLGWIRYEDRDRLL